MQLKNLLAFSAAVATVSASGSIALYWGQKSGLSLADTCDDADADIVILSFLNDFGISKPSLNFAGNCEEQDSDGMLTCPEIGKGIQHCQSKGKKVLLALGGGVGSYGFNDDSQAEDFAETLWNLFGEGSGKKPLSPGTVDGFDFDIENNNNKGYAALVKKLKSDYFPKGSKQYYISSAPQCPYPDASVGDLLTNAPVDYAFIQFYNNPSCSLTGSFNFDTWSSEASSSFANKNIKLFVGLPGSPDSAGSGYVGDIDVLKKQIGSAAKSSHFGGVMFWDAYTANKNTLENGENIIKAAREIMGDAPDSPSSSVSASPSSVPTVSSDSQASTTVNASSAGQSATTISPHVTGDPIDKFKEIVSSGNTTTTVGGTTTITIPIYRTITVAASDTPRWSNGTRTTGSFQPPGGSPMDSGNSAKNPSLGGGANSKVKDVTITVTATATVTQTATVTSTSTKAVTVTVSAVPKTVSICQTVAPSASPNLAAREYAVRHKHAARI